MKCEYTEAAASFPALKHCTATAMAQVGTAEANFAMLSAICLLHSEEATIQNINIFTGSYHMGYLLFKALTVPHREPYKMLLQKILRSTVFRESVGKQASSLLFISPKSLANICKLSHVSQFVFS